MSVVEIAGRVDQIRAVLDDISGRTADRATDAAASSAGGAAGGLVGGAAGGAGLFAQILGTMALNTTPSGLLTGTALPGAMPPGTVLQGATLQGATLQSAETSTGPATGQDVALTALGYLGVPYVFGGEDRNGMDCSGLVQRVFADLGVSMPRLVSGQMTMGTEVGSLAAARPGDLIVAKGGSHILIYAGEGKVIHAPYEGRDVSIQDCYLSNADIQTIRRVLPTEPVVTQTPAAGTDLLRAVQSAAILGAFS